MLPQSLWVHGVHQFSFIWRTLLPWSHLLYLNQWILLPFLCNSLNTQGKSLMMTLYSVLSGPKSQRPYITQCWISVFIPIHIKKKHLCWGQNHSLTYGDRSICLGVILLLCSLSRKIQANFPIGPWPMTVSVFYMILILVIFLNSSQTLPTSLLTHIHTLSLIRKEKCI